MQFKPGQLIEHRDYKFRAIVTSITQDEIELFVFYNPPPRGADPKHYTIGPTTIGTCRSPVNSAVPSRNWSKLFKRIQ